MGRNNGVVHTQAAAAAMARAPIVQPSTADASVVEIPNYATNSHLARPTATAPASKHNKPYVLDVLTNTWVSGTIVEEVRRSDGTITYYRVEFTRGDGVKYTGHFAPQNIRPTP